MQRTGRQIVTAAFREIGVVDPIEAAGAELLADGILCASELLDSWREDKLTIGGLMISTYNLASGQATRTIGVGGHFNQTWPASIDYWSVIPDDDETDPVELPMGRPLRADEWQRVRIKTQTGPYPDKLYYDAAYAAGLGTCYFHPIPDNNDVDVKLYQKVPTLTALIATTTYDLRPAVTRALQTNLAVELADRYGKEVTDRLERRATRALGILKRGNITLRESPIRAEFAIGAERRTGFNIYTGGR